MSTPQESQALTAATSEGVEAAVVRDLAAQAFEAEPLEPGKVYLAAAPNGAQKLIDLEEFAAQPRFARASRVFYDADSFARYLARHGEDRTEVFADVQTARITAIIDSHYEEPGWQFHHATLVLTQSPSWKAWLGKDGVLLPQAEFAEFIELQAGDVRTPFPTDLLDLAQTFEATKSVEYESSERLADGQTRLAYRETVQAKAGQRGDVAIPASLTLALRPYIGGPIYAVIARFRYRIDREQHLRLGYVIERPQVTLDAAFEDVLTALHAGRPESSVGAGDDVPAVQAPIYQGRA